MSLNVPIDPITVHMRGRNAVTGDIPFLVAHLKDDHKVDMHNGSTFNHRYVKSNPQEVENATWMLTLGMAPVYIAFLRFMVDDNEAKNYSYSLEVGGNGRKMVWQGEPETILTVLLSNVIWLSSSRGRSEGIET